MPRPQMLKQPCFMALMGSGEQAQQLTSNLVVRVRIDRLNCLPEQLKSSAGGLASIPPPHVRPVSVKNGREVDVQIVQDRIPRW
jgi:hypothetical protein